MAMQVVTGAMLQCSFGVAPSSLVDSHSKCMCNWVGIIQVVNPGQVTVQDG